MTSEAPIANPAYGFVADGLPKTYFSFLAGGPMAKDEAGTPAEESQVVTTAMSDHSLLQRYRRGSEDAATQLYLRYVHRLRGLAEAQMSPGLARQMDIDDLVQSVFGSFFRRAGNGDYDVPAGEELWKLFLVIALNKIRGAGAFHHAAKRDARRMVGGPHLDHFLEGAGGDNASFAFLQLVIDEALGRLRPAQRRMVELRVEGYEVAEIAQKTQRSKRTVERSLQQALEKLGNLLHEET
jgi:RNA polymerase sigma factor (sigma-70 family)